MNRRKFVTGVITTAFMNQLLTDSLFGIVNAEAAGTTGLTKNYISFWMSGGAERSWFDCVLNPNGNDPLGLGAGLVTAPSLTEGPAKWINRLTTNKVNDKYYLPYLWESNLPTVAGTSVPMKSLASNMAIVRGVQTGLTFDAHEQNAYTVQVPFPGLSFLGGVADSSSDVMIPAVLSKGHFTSNSNKNSSFVPPTANAYEIFKALQFQSGRNDPYTRSPSKVMGLRKFDNVVSSFINSLTDQMPARKAKTFGIMMDNRKKAVDLLEKGFGGIEADYNAAHSRYFQLVNQVMNPTGDRILSGFDDKDFKGTGTAYNYNLGVEGRYGGFSPLQGFKISECNNLVSGFAKAEIYMKYGITNCMQFEIGELSRIYDQFSNQASETTFTFDCHYTGQVIRGIAFSRFYQSFAACLNLFKGQIGGLAWGQTLVHLRSEFNRSKAQERGSDHNIWGNVETFFSGAIAEGPIVGGNLGYQDNATCDGNGAAIPELNNEKIESKHIYSTVATLMGFEPSRNHMTLLKPSNGKIVSNLPAPRNLKVAG